MNIHTSGDPLHIYVINMKKDKDRMECFEKQVNSQFEYERIEGVDVTSHEYNNIYMKWKEAVSKRLQTLPILYTEVSGFDTSRYPNKTICVGTLDKSR